MDDDHQARYERIRLRAIQLRAAIRGLNADAAEVAALTALAHELAAEAVGGLVEVGDPRTQALQPEQHAREVH